MIIDTQFVITQKRVKDGLLHEDELLHEYTWKRFSSAFPLSGVSHAV